MCQNKLCDNCKYIGYIEGNRFEPPETYCEFDEEYFYLDESEIDEDYECPHCKIFDEEAEWEAAHGGAY